MRTNAIEWIFYPITVMFYLFKNSVITWPENLKLESINAANQFISGRSHHAMVDVEVTLELARRFMAERDMWDYLQGYFKKDIDKTRLEQVQKEIALLVSGKIGSKARYQCPVLFLGNHLHYKNQSVWLRLDTEEFEEKPFAINKKPGEPNFILPCKERFLHHISSDRMALAQKNYQWLKMHPEKFDEITSYYINYQYPVFPTTDTDARLYLDGFWSEMKKHFFVSVFMRLIPGSKQNFCRKQKMCA